MCSNFLLDYLDQLRVKPHICPLCKSVGIKNFNQNNFKCGNFHQWEYRSGCKILINAGISESYYTRNTTPIIESSICDSIETSIQNMIPPENSYSQPEHINFLKPTETYDYTHFPNVITHRRKSNKSRSQNLYEN
jgi:hypothetical protein